MPLIFLMIEGQIFFKLKKFCNNPKKNSINKKVKLKITKLYKQVILLNFECF